MHVADGALSAPVLIGGGVLAVWGLALGLRKLDMDTIPATGILSATLFVASLVHFPVGASSVHLVMNGLAGLVLGWAAFPALVVALLLQAAFFGFGGVTVLGINSFNIAAPAVLMYFICRRGVIHARPSVAAIWGAVAGAGTIVGSTVLVALSLALSGEQFIPAAQVTILVQIPVMIIEGAVTAAAVYLVRKVKPELFSTVTHLREFAPPQAEEQKRAQ